MADDIDIMIADAEARGQRVLAEEPRATAVPVTRRRPGR
jgi:hypothetical protein